MKVLDRTFSVAPMMDWTTSHYRYLARQLSRNTLLYTEMVTTGALIHGDTARFLRHDEAEYPLALQLGGSDTGELAHCAELLGLATRSLGAPQITCGMRRITNGFRRPSGCGEATRRCSRCGDTAQPPGGCMCPTAVYREAEKSSPQKLNCQKSIFVKNAIKHTKNGVIRHRHA